MKYPFSNFALGRGVQSFFRRKFTQFLAIDIVELLDFSWQEKSNQKS